MKIETKFNIGDEIWVMQNNKAIKVEILASRVTNWGIRGKSESEYYVESHSSVVFGDFCNESDLYPTKAELLESL